MTGKERLLNAINGKPTDRVPVTLFIQGQGHYISQIKPDLDPWDFVALQKEVVDYQRSLGVDIHVRLLFFNPHEPVFAVRGMLNVDNESDNWKVNKSIKDEGSEKFYNYEIITPGGKLTQTMCIIEQRPGTYVYATTKKPIESVHDLELAMEYEPPFNDSIKAKMKINTKKVKSMVGDDGIFSAWGGGSLFNSMSGLIDHSELYSIFLTDPDFYAMLMKYVKKKVFEYSDAVIYAGVDAICMAGNVAGGFIGKRMFDEFILPHEREYVDYVQNKGIPIIYHNCGLIMNLVESYKELGVKNVEPFSPPPLGDADLNKLKELVNGEYSVTCGIDQINVLQKGSLKDVEAATIDLIKKGKSIKSFIFQNADFLEYNTPEQNIEHLVKIALANADF